MSVYTSCSTTTRIFFAVCVAKNVQKSCAARPAFLFSSEFSGVVLVVVCCVCLCKQHLLASCS
jgi:hypothetical protein